MGIRRIYSFSKNNQHVDYRLVNQHNTVKHRTWVSEAFTLSKGNRQRPDYLLVNPLEALK